VPITALGHFRSDLSRTRAILTHAAQIPDADHRLRSDLFRSAWMFAIGALDAYFCDAYADVVAASVSSKSRQDSISLPDFFYEIKFPIRAILEEYVNPNWRWRMAARKMMERENVLSLSTVQRLFDKFFRKGHRFFGEIIASWIIHPDSKMRLFGISSAAYLTLNPQQTALANEVALHQFQIRFEELFQRRHDCIHNCDRPRVSPQPLRSAGTILKVIQDVEFLVERCDAHIATEFRQFLISIGCNAATITAAGY